MTTAALIALVWCAVAVLIAAANHRRPRVTVDVARTEAPRAAEATWGESERLAA